MDPHHRKVDLQSPSDLAYLLTNIRTAAQQKLDLHIPPSAAPQGEEDAFRTKVEELVHQYITQTLTLALPSLSINGFDASPSLLTSSTSTTTRPDASDDTNYEPYDPRLAAKVRALYAQLESETTRIAELRREAPVAAAKAYVERLGNEVKEDEMAMEELRGIVRKQEVQGLDVNIEREEAVGQMWERGVEGFVGLGRVTETVARCERAGRAAEAVERM